MNKYGYTLSLCFLLFTSAIFSQDTTAIPAENVEVIKRYEASIAQAKRKKISFKTKEKSISPLSYNYSVTTEKVIDFDRPDPEIKALGYSGKMKTNDEIKNGYIYGGYGSRATLNAGVAYHYYIEDWLEAGLKVDHFSAADSLDLGQFSYSHTDVSAYAGYSLGEHTSVRLDGHSVYRRHDFHSGLGVDTIARIPVDKYGVDLGFSHNAFEEQGFVVRTGGSYLTSYQKWDDFKDNTIQAKLNILKTVNEKMSVELPFMYQRIAHDSKLLELEKQKVSDFIVNPNFRLRGDNYCLKAGVNYISGDSISLIFPLLNISLNNVVAGIDLSLFTDLDYRRNSLYALSSVNPYYQAFTSDYSPYNKRSYSLSAQKKHKTITGKITFSYNSYDNDVNFRDEYASPRSEATYINRDEFTIQPEISFLLDDKVNIGLSGQYNFFLTDSLELFYKPKFLLQLDANEKFFNGKLKFNQSISLTGSRAVNTDYDNIFIEPVEEGLGALDTYVDLSLGFSYKINPILSIYGRGVNLLGSEYELWKFQPVFQTQLWGGIRVKI